MRRLWLVLLVLSIGVALAAGVSAQKDPAEAPATPTVAESPDSAACGADAEPPADPDQLGAELAGLFQDLNASPTVRQCPEQRPCDYFQGCFDKSCSTRDTGVGVICERNGEIFTCPPGQSVHVKTCLCDSYEPRPCLAGLEWFCR